MNSEVLNDVTKAGAKLVAVTKYLDDKETHKAILSLENLDCFWGIGENRIESIETKKVNRSRVHFIGNIQSRNIKRITHHCAYIHSLSKENHFKKLAEAIKETPTEVFLQINISEEKSKSGFLTEDVPRVFNLLKQFPNLKKSIIGISALGTEKATQKQTEKEIKQLKLLRDEYIPEGYISYGTSQDYKKSLLLGASVVRIGRALWDEPVKKL